ncbi:SpaA isopeptide-forming pilin-related protein [Bifidobacterium animalis]|uniref:SpaA isopeptide-forming pilin-related protein n=1 Tax=Bifidobacterium animalis TaxID=28025 RepID=UPI001C3EAEB3|nr:SpaA isopeptide-forming pilin-related protein [Bifidobacterium animalis]MCR1995071.1 SpaA isopeptide-forming pilin-related protein [Bifidobacterium animalis subsp. animalis]
MKKKWQLAGVTGISLAMLFGLSAGPAMAADIPAGTDSITISAGQGSTLAGKNLTVYRIAEYPDVVMNGNDLASLSARSVSNDTENWVKAALDAQHVTVKAGDNASSTLLRVKDDTDTIRQLAARLATTVNGRNLQSKRVTSNTMETTISLPAGYYLITDTDGVPILVSSTVQTKNSLNRKPIGKTTVKSNGIKPDKKVKNLAGQWVDEASATNSETREYRVQFTVPNRAAVQNVTIGDVMTNMEYVNGTFHATVDGNDVTGQFDTPTKTSTGFTVKSNNTFVQAHQGRQATVTYQTRMTTLDKTKPATNQVGITPGWKNGLFLEGQPKPPVPTDTTTLHTYDFGLRKVSAGNTSKVIAGAGFKIQNQSALHQNKWMNWNASTKQWSYVDAESSATELKTGADGVIDFRSLGAGTYLVKETTVPAGYFTNIKPSFRVTITEDGKITVAGVDQAGLVTPLNAADGKTGTPMVTVQNVDNVSQLPKTGSTTLAILLFGGMAVILAAGVAGVTAYRLKSRI